MRCGYSVCAGIRAGGWREVFGETITASRASNTMRRTQDSLDEGRKIREFRGHSSYGRCRGIGDGFLELLVGRRLLGEGIADIEVTGLTEVGIGETWSEEVQKMQEGWALGGTIGPTVQHQRLSKRQKGKKNQR